MRWQLRQRYVGKKGCFRNSRRSVLWQRGHANPVGWRCCSSHATHVASSSSSVIGKSIMFGSIPCTLRPHEPKYLPNRPVPSNATTLGPQYRECRSRVAHFSASTRISTREICYHVVRKANNVAGLLNNVAQKVKFDKSAHCQKRL